MDVSIQLKKQFCKDSEIPITLFDEPYFTERLMLFDKFYDSIKKWNVFIEGLSEYDSEHDYIKEYYRIINAAIESITGSDGYRKFCNEDRNNWKLKYPEFQHLNVCTKEYEKKILVSLKMQKADFNVLRMYNPGIFKEAGTWEEFMSGFTENRHIINSDYVRKKIFQHCNPTRQLWVKRYFMDGILDGIIENQIANKENIISVSGSKIIAENLKTDVKLPLFETELFSVHQIKGTHGFYEFYSKDKIKFKEVNHVMLPFVLRTAQMQDFTDDDTFFSYKGNLAKLVDIPKIIL